MLKQRVITALLLLAVLLPVLFLPQAWPFAVLTLLFIAAAGWEWGRLNGLSFAGACLLGGLVAVACALGLAEGVALAPPHGPWWLATLAWVLGGAWVLRAGVARWPRAPKALRWLIGVLALCAAWLALTQAKAAGANLLLSILALVWAADIAAYFGGRALGRRKLAPAISPGKSWEGVWSGMVGALALAGLWIALDRAFQPATPSLFTLLFDRAGPLGLLLGVVFLAAFSVVGDLFESLVKRSAGAKDSSGLLPGHGGVLDRIDALLPVFPLALALIAV